MKLFRFVSLAAVSLALLTSAGRAFDQSHAAFDRILQQHVSDGFVDYTALQAARRPLGEYLAQLAAVSKGEFAAWSKQDQLAFLINLYNAATLNLIVDNYPVKSIRSIGWVPGSAWKQKIVLLFGEKISLDDLEHGTIRQSYHEPRVHFALVCAARGCPPLRAEAYTGEKLDHQLDDQGRKFLGDTQKNRFDATTRTAQLSPIFRWFAEDFGETPERVLAFIAPFLPEQSQLPPEHGDIALSYTDYDWSLNDRAKP